MSAVIQRLDLMDFQFSSIIWDLVKGKFQSGKDETKPCIRALESDTVYKRKIIIKDMLKTDLGRTQ